MATPQSSTPTVYFGYGSNLWLHQMSTRCPTSTYLGIARLNNYTWIINDRGYANVVANSDAKEDRNTTASSYSKSVYGLVYGLLPSDEVQLDKNEGVPIAYTKEYLPCDLWSSSDPSFKLDESKRPDEQGKKMLVYIDRKRITADEPRKEYVYRMNRGIEDAVKCGVPEGYVRDVMRKYIPAEEGERRRSEEEFARGQAAEFRDESGVFE